MLFRSNGVCVVRCIDALPCSERVHVLFHVGVLVFAGGFVRETVVRRVTPQIGSAMVVSGQKRRRCCSGAAGGGTESANFAGGDCGVSIVGAVCPGAIRASLRCLAASIGSL